MSKFKSNHPLHLTAGLQDADTLPENSELESLYAMEAEDRALQQMKDRIAEESGKGAATRNQQTLWDKVLEMRILLQKSLSSSQQLPQTQELQAVKAFSPGCSTLLDTLTRVILLLHSLRQDLTFNTDAENTA